MTPKNVSRFIVAYIAGLIRTIESWGTCNTVFTNTLEAVVAVAGVELRICSLICLVTLEKVT